MGDTDRNGGDSNGPPPDGASQAPAGANDMRSISPTVQALWGIRVLVGAIVVAVTLGLIATRVSLLPNWTGPAVGLTIGVVGLVWVRLRYRRWTFQIRSTEVYLERGVVTHVRTIVPFVRIQHVDTQRGPLERVFGLSTLVIYTAGSRGADVSIPGLYPREASGLQSRLKELAVDDDGGDAV